jgi:carbohydrate-selective porin OprB
VLQPDLQYIINPGAGILNNISSLGRVHNELVAGMRAVTTF